MTFRSFIDYPCGIRYMFDALKLQSSCGRKMLLDSYMMRSISEVEKSYIELREVYEELILKDNSILLNKMHCLRDISGTILRLKEGAIIDDIELFEIKYLSILSEDVRNILSKALLKSIVLPVLEDVVNILDPDGLKISSFYVYDVYSAELREVRRKIKVINTTLEVNLNEQDITLQEQLQELTQRMLEIEIDVRRELSGKLRGYVVMLDSALKGLAKLDILFAKGLQIKEMGLCFPSVSMDCKTSYKGLFHPQIKDVLEKQGKFFTPINIEFALEPVTIIGANMGGKTVVLKMAALSQLLFQFGFGIPAQNACVDIKNSVLLCIGDEQNELSGLSSFAAEVKAIDNVLCCVKRGERILALIDEPARTTNPVEGTALVSALLKVLYKKEVSVLLTTHYNIGGDFYKRFRVRGFINNVMDYRLVEALSGEIPHEAVGIAESLGADMEWMGETKKILIKLI